MSIQNTHVYDNLKDFKLHSWGGGGGGWVKNFTLHNFAHLNSYPIYFHSFI